MLWQKSSGSQSASLELRNMLDASGSAMMAGLLAGATTATTATTTSNATATTSNATAEPSTTAESSTATLRAAKSSESLAESVAEAGIAADESSDTFDMISKEDVGDKNGMCPLTKSAEDNANASDSDWETDSDSSDTASIDSNSDQIYRVLTSDSDLGTTTVVTLAHFVASDNISTVTTSVTFHEEARPMDDNASTYIVSPTYGHYEYDASWNGTVWTEISAGTKTPKKTAKTVKNTIKDKLSLQNVKHKIQTLTEDAKDALSARVNSAAQGHDVPAIMGTIVEPIANITQIRPPSTKDLIRYCEGLADALQAIFEGPAQPAEYPTDRNVDGVELLFGRTIAARALKALVRQDICDKWIVTPAQDNWKWQAQLCQHLANAFINNQYKDEVPYTVAELFQMQPVWTRDTGANHWTLVLKSDLTEIGVNALGEAEDRVIVFDTEYVLPEEVCRAEPHNGYYDM